MGSKYTNFRVDLTGLENREVWYAFTTQYNYESYVIERIIDMNNLLNNVKDVFTPSVERDQTYTTQKKKIEKTKKVKENLLPNYVFVKLKLTIDAYKLIMNITGVYGVMAVSGIPSEISEKDIENIKSKMALASEHEIKVS